MKQGTHGVCKQVNQEQKRKKNVPLSPQPDIVDPDRG